MQFSFMKMHLRMPFIKCNPFCIEANEFIQHYFQFSISHRHNHYSFKLSSYLVEQVHSVVLAWQTHITCYWIMLALTNNVWWQTRVQCINGCLQKGTVCILNRHMSLWTFFPFSLTWCDKWPAYKLIASHRQSLFPQQEWPILWPF